MESGAKKNIRHLSLQQIKDYLESKGIKAFHAKQLYEWLWKKSARSFDEMSNLSKELREFLNMDFSIRAVSVAEEQISSDRTIKNAFRLHDGKITEGVLIPSKKRMTACISSQVGCSLSCAFCATGRLARLRNIDFDEIYDQVAIIKEHAEK